MMSYMKLTYLELFNVHLKLYFIRYLNSQHKLHLA